MSRPNQKNKDVNAKNKARKSKNLKPRSTPKPIPKHTPSKDHQNINCMNIWKTVLWKKCLNNHIVRRTGLRFRYDNTVDPEVKRACAQFAGWLRSEYQFPLRIVVYVKGTKTIRAKDGDTVVGTFFEPFLYEDEPYIRLATGDYNELVYTLGKDNALASILLSLAHELTHYFQWINGVQLSDIGKERQAVIYSRKIMDEYALTCEHP